MLLELGCVLVSALHRVERDDEALVGHLGRAGAAQLTCEDGEGDCAQRLADGLEERDDGEGGVSRAHAAPAVSGTRALVCQRDNVWRCSEV
jgi:hypothetical protein